MQHAKKCKKCNGSGKITRNFQSKGEQFEEEINCGKCRGKGALGIKDRKK